MMENIRAERLSHGWKPCSHCGELGHPVRDLRDGLCWTCFQARSTLRAYRGRFGAAQLAEAVPALDAATAAARQVWADRSREGK